MTEPPTTGNRTRMDIITPGCLAFTAELLDWLERHNLNIEDLEATIRHRCNLGNEGLKPEEITRYVLAAHKIDESEAPYVRAVATLMLTRRRLTRLRGGRYTTSRAPDGPYVVAVVRIPVEDWERFGLNDYIHRGRAAYVAGDDDRA